MQWSRSAGFGERSRLVDDAHARLLGLDDDALDLRELVLDLRVQGHRRFDRGLRMEFGRKRDLEQHVLHDVAAERLRERHGLALEQDVLETPGLRRQRGGVAHLASQREQREPHRAAGRIAGRPALARSGVRRVPVGAQRAAVDPRVRHGIDDLFARPAEHRRDDRGRGYAHQEHVVEPDAVEAVLEREHALYFVRLDHSRQDVAHAHRRCRCATR